MQTVKDNDKQYCPHGILRDAADWGCIPCAHQEYLELRKIKNKIKNLQQAPQTSTKRDRNYRDGIRGDKRSEAAQIRLMKDIFDLAANHNDYEIMSLLKVPKSTYQRYKSRMHQEAKELWQQTCTESLEYRGLHLIDSLQKGHKINNEIAQDNQQSAKDRIEASFKAFQAQLFHFMLIRDGPLELMKQHSSLS